MALTNVPTVLGEDIIAIIPGTETNDFPTDFTNAIYIQDSVNKMPQFFPDRETKEYKVLGSKQAKKLQGGRGAVDGNIDAYYVKIFADGYAKMIEYQNQPAGCFWIVWFINAEQRTVALRATVDDEIKTPEGESGDDSVKPFKITNVGDAIQYKGDGDEVKPATMTGINP